MGGGGRSFLRIYEFLPLQFWCISLFSFSPPSISLSLSLPLYRVTSYTCTVCFWYLIKRDLSSVRVCYSVHWTSHILQGTRNTRPCLSGRVVQSLPQLFIYFDILIDWRSGYSKRKFVSIPAYSIGKQYDGLVTWERKDSTEEKQGLLTQRKEGTFTSWTKG